MNGLAGLDVRFGSKAGKTPMDCDVRSSPNNRHTSDGLDVRFVLIATMRTAANSGLFDHLVRAQQY